VSLHQNQDIYLIYHNLDSTTLIFDFFYEYDIEHENPIRVTNDKIKKVTIINPNILQVELEEVLNI